MTLERSGCFGSCPDYKVEFHRGGKAFYVGGQYAPRHGRHESVMDLHSYALLCSYITRTDLTSLQGRYAASWTDDEEITATFEGERGVIVIADYGRYAPPEFQAYVALFDDIVEHIDWSPIETPADSR